MSFVCSSVWGRAIRSNAVRGSLMERYYEGAVAVVELSWIGAVLSNFYCCGPRTPELVLSFISHIRLLVNILVLLLQRQLSCRSRIFYQMLLQYYNYFYYYIYYNVYFIYFIFMYNHICAA